MNNVACLRLFAAVLCIGSAGLRAGAQAPPPPVITEAFVDAETATLTFNGAGFRTGFPVVHLGNRELPVRWAIEASVATWLPELWPGTYRLSARWPDGSYADFFLTIGAVGSSGPTGERGPEGPRGMPGFAPAASREPSATAEPDGAADETTTTDPEGTTRYGTGALANLTTGAHNSAFGADALENATTGGYNAAFGRAALENLTTTNANSAFGQHALRRLTTGSHNSAFGTGALSSLTAGVANTAVGNAAMHAHDHNPGALTGMRNTGVGAQALSGLGAGSNNTAVGWRTLSNRTGHDAIGSRNTAIGVQALHVATGSSRTGSDNVAIGYRAAILNPTGSNNIYIGSQGNSSDGSGRIRIGTWGTHTNTILAGRVEVEQGLAALAVQTSGDVQARVLVEGETLVSLIDTAALASTLETKVTALEARVTALENPNP